MSVRPDPITATATDSKFLPHPEGQFVAKCIDTINLGEVVIDFPGKPPYLASKCVVLFRTGEVNPDTGDLIDIGAEFTISMGEKANLRRFLESWRGKSYTEEEEKKGVPLDKLTGNLGLITVEHRQSAKKRTYALIKTISGVPKQMQAHIPAFPEYTERAAYWTERKEANREAAMKFRASIGQATDDGGDPGPTEPASDDDELPF